MLAGGYQRRGNWTYKSQKALTRQELMKAAEMLARDLVLRVCASDGEFRRDWIARGVGPKRVVPLAVAPGADPDLADAIAGAATEMGAKRLLACRTRAAFMYDPVIAVPVNPQALLDVVARWGQPDDFLVCLPDGSAAVLVSVAGYALAAGQATFVAAMAGPDVAGACERFTVWARESGDQRLRVVAGRYGGPSSRHAPRRALGPDVAERMSAVAAAVRRHAPATAALRFSAAVAGWAAITLIVITLLSAPRSSHVLPAAGGALWLLLQVFVLARTHTLSWAACLRMAAAGGACAIVFAAAARLAVSPGILHAWRASLGPVEETVKLVPVLVFWLLARNRFTRLAAVDYLLLGAASGAGFAIVENTVTALAMPGTGWHIAALLPGWSDAGAVRFPGEAVATGLAAGGMGLAATTRPLGTTAAAMRRRWWRWWRWLAWLLPIALLGMAMLDHYHYDAVADGVAVPGWLSRLHAVLGNGHASRWLLLALIAASMAVDFAAQRRVTDLVPPLPGVPLWARLARDARGSQVSARMRWSARTARGRRARRLAMARVAVTETLVGLTHEAAFLLVALLPRRRPRGVLAASLVFARQRREFAMREARAGGRIRRDVPRREGLWTAWRRLIAALALGGPAVGAVVLPRVTQIGSARWPALGRALHAVAIRGGEAAALQRAVGGHRRSLGVPRSGPGGLVSSIPALHAWFNQFIFAGQVLIIAAAIGVFLLLVSGWALPVPLVQLASTRRAGRASRQSVVLRGLAATPSPGQFLFRLLRLGGDLLPPATARLLAGQGVARPYQRLPSAQHAIPGRPPPALPRSATEGLQTDMHNRDGDDLDRSGWLFPAEQVRRWLGHAPEFGVEPVAGVEPGDAADATARLTDVLRHIAEAAGSLRLEDVTFRNRPARAVVDRASGAAVFFTPAGEFTGCAVLTEEQLFRLVTELKL